MSKEKAIEKIQYEKIQYAKMQLRYRHVLLSLMKRQR